MPSPIPVRLWDQAVRLARHYGVSRISKIFRGGYFPLKERVERQKYPVAVEPVDFRGQAGETARKLASHQLQVLLSAGNPAGTQAAPD